MTEIQKNILSQLVNMHSGLTYTTEVIGEIRTTSDIPVYGKYYPYYASLQKEVETQIEELLADDIIRPSRSPYNSPVPSKPKKFRLVIDFR